MRIAKIILLVSSLSLLYISYITNFSEEKGTAIGITPSVDRAEPIVVERDTISDLIDAMIQVESTGNDSAVNHRTSAVGCLQIRPIMVEDVNRILTVKKYSLSDRYSRKKSIEMFNIWRGHYHKGSTMQTMARCWNGGTNGEKKKVTIKYWNKIKRLWKEKSKNLKSTSKRMV